MSAPLEGMFLKNRYTIQRHIATGGMAAVFLGWDYRIERPVAIKVLRQLEAATPRDIERFQREAQAAATLNHPHVVQVFDFFEEHGCCFLIMEYVEGVNLKSHLRARGALPQGEALALGEQVCAALEAAHAGGFIHRDIKPQNVLLDCDGWAKLTDFGIVQALREARMTTTGAVLGTADYIAPEQARGEPLTPASDLYALGVVLYELLTGRLPFIGRTPLLVATQHATAPVVPPDRYVPGLSPYVQAVVLRALRKQPDHRYQTAARMRLALRLAREAAADGALTGESDEFGVEHDMGGMAVPIAGSHAHRAGADAVVALAEADTVVGATLDHADAVAHSGADRSSEAGSALESVSAGRSAARTHTAYAHRQYSTAMRARLALIAAPAEAPGAAVGDTPQARDVEPRASLRDEPPDHESLRWRRLGMTALAALALLALFLLLGLWLHLPGMLSRALP